MGFWEKGYFSSAVIIFLTGCAYAVWVWYQSQAAGALAEPIPAPFILAMLACISVSVTTFLIIARLESRKDKEAKHPDAFDERDRLIGLYAKSGTSHVLGFGVYLTLIAFFVHRDANLLFYSVFAVAITADITRCLLQVYHYNRAI